MYDQEELLHFLTSSCELVSTFDPNSVIIIAGDVNQLKRIMNLRNKSKPLLAGFESKLNCFIRGNQQRAVKLELRELGGQLLTHYWEDFQLSIS